MRLVDRPDVFMPLFIGDYLAGTSRLTTELHGAYLLLIMDYWMNGPPPNDDQVLASIAKMNLDAWSKARAVLEKFFSIDQGCWKHKRIEQELANAFEKKRAAKEKAEKAAAARWAKPPKNAPSNAPSTPQAVLEECPSPSPSPSPIEPNGSNNNPAPLPPQEPAPREIPGLAHPIPKNWSPNPETMGMLAQHNIPEYFIWDLVPEFELYWRERGESALTWGNKFLKHVLKHWREFQASPPATPAQRLPKNWLPSQEAVEALTSSGIDELFIASLVPEFVIFWHESNRAHQAWNAKFMNHVKHQWETRQTPGPKSTRDLTLDEQLNDRTWAEPSFSPEYPDVGAERVMS